MRKGERELGKNKLSIVGFRLARSAVGWYCRYGYEEQEGDKKREEGRKRGGNFEGLKTRGD